MHMINIHILTMAKEILLDLVTTYNERYSYFNHHDRVTQASHTEILTVSRTRLEARETPWAGHYIQGRQNLAICKFCLLLGIIYEVPRRSDTFNVRLTKITLRASRSRIVKTARNLHIEIRFDSSPSSFRYLLPP